MGFNTRLVRFDPDLHIGVDHALDANQDFHGFTFLFSRSRGHSVPLGYVCALRDLEEQDLKETGISVKKRKVVPHSEPGGSRGFRMDI